MSQASHDALSAAFAALADPTRRAILARLALGESPVGELVKPFPISAPAISRHLRVLEKARLIERKVDAQWRICKLHPPGLRLAVDWLAPYRAFWDDSLDRLVEVLEQNDNPTALAPGRPRRSPGTGPQAPAPSPGSNRISRAPRARPIPPNRRRKPS